MSCLSALSCKWTSKFQIHSFVLTDVPTQDFGSAPVAASSSAAATAPLATTEQYPIASSVANAIQTMPSMSASTASVASAIVTTSAISARPGSMVRVPEMPITPAGSVSNPSGTSASAPTATAPATAAAAAAATRHSGHSRNSSWDLRSTYSSNGSARNAQVSALRGVYEPKNSYKMHLHRVGPPQLILERHRWIFDIPAIHRLISIN